MVVIASLNHNIWRSSCAVILIVSLSSSVIPLFLVGIDLLFQASTLADKFKDSKAGFAYTIRPVDSTEYEVDEIDLHEKLLKPIYMTDFEETSSIDDSFNYPIAGRSRSIWFYNVSLENWQYEGMNFNEMTGEGTHPKNGQKIVSRYSEVIIEDVKIEFLNMMKSVIIITLSIDDLSIDYALE